MRREVFVAAIPLLVGAALLAWHLPTVRLALLAVALLLPALRLCRRRRPPPNGPSSVRLAVIGAGVSGLSAALFAARRGVRVDVYERRSEVGHVLVVGRYAVDRSLRWLPSECPRGSRALLSEACVATSPTPAELDVVDEVSGRALRVACDGGGGGAVAGGLEQSLLAAAAGDAKSESHARRFAAMVRSAAACAPALPAVADELRGVGHSVLSALANYRFLLLIHRTMFHTCGQWASGMAGMFLTYLYSSVTSSRDTLLSAVLTLAPYASGEALLARDGAEHSILRALGDLPNCVLHLDSTVVRVVVDSGNGKATGVQLRDGTTHSADCVISTVNLRLLVEKMVGEDLEDPRVTAFIRRSRAASPFCVVSVGVRSDLGRRAGAVERLRILEPLVIGAVAQPDVWMRVVSHDDEPDGVPSGCSLVQVAVPAHYAHWERLPEKECQAESDKLARDVVAVISRRLSIDPNDTIDFTDVDTPVAYKKRTLCTAGSPSGWERASSWQYLDPPIRQLRPVQGLFLAGKWCHSTGGGVVRAVQTAKEAVQLALGSMGL
eukprot:m51a1_g2681 putative FAD-dependent oxidoreductase (551) ;mRNA; f:742754-744572